MPSNEYKEKWKDSAMFKMNVSHTEGTLINEAAITALLVRVEKLELANKTIKTKYNELIDNVNKRNEN